MAKYLTTNTLIDSVTRKGMLPETQVTFTEQDFLAFANEEMDLGVVPHILSFHEDYLLTHTEIPLNVNKKRYEIPEDANGSKIRDVAFIDNSGGIYEMTRILVEDIAYYQDNSFNNVTIGLRPFLIEGSEIVLMPSNDSALLSEGGKLRVYYYKRPNEIVSEDRVSRVVSVDAQKNIVTIDAATDTIQEGDELDITSSRNPHRLIGNKIVPNSYPDDTDLTYTFGTVKSININVITPTLGSYLRLDDATNKNKAVRVYWFDTTGTDTPPIVSDVTSYIRIDVSDVPSLTVLAQRISSSINLLSPVIKATPSGPSLIIENGGNSICVGDNFSVSNFGTATVLQPGTSTLPEYIKKDDVISLTSETIIPQVPQELHSMLAQRVVLRCLEALNDSSGYQIATVKLQEMEAKTATIIDNRVEGSPKKVVNRHAHLRYTTRRV